MRKTFNIKFYEKRNLYFAISLCLFIVGTIMIFVNGVNLDIQFKGGSIIKYSYEGDINKETFAAKASEVLGIKADAQETSDFTGGNKQIVLNVAGDVGLTPERQQSLYAAL